MSNKLVKVLTNVVNICKTDNFMKDFRMSKKDFTRNRKLSFFDYISIIMQCSKTSLQSTLNMFFHSQRNRHMEYSKQAFSKGRHRIKFEAFKCLMEESAKTFYEDGKFKKYRDYLLLSMDGSDYNLPNSDELLQAFGSEKFTSGYQVQALTSTLYDVLNGIVLEAEIEPYNANERKIAITHLQNFRSKSDKKAIVMMDRGYPSFELMNVCENLNMKYLMRCNKDNFLKEIRNIKNDDETITITREGIDLTVRVVTIIVRGKPITFLTNLTEQECRKSDFKELYAKRWNIETLYNKLKNTLEIENFSGLDELCVKQDYYASMLLINLTACAMYESQNNLEKKSKEGHLYKVNRTFAVSELKMRLIKMIYTDSASVRLFQSREIKKALKKNVIQVQPGRTNKRKVAHPCLKNSTNHKRTVL